MFGRPVSLDCELTVVLSFFSPVVGGTERLKRAEVEYFPSPGQLGSDNTPRG